LGDFRIRLVVLEGGERLPLLLDQDGFPLFRPAVWMMTMRRAINMATATLKEDLQALKSFTAGTFGPGKTSRIECWPGNSFPPQNAPRWLMR